MSRLPRRRLLAALLAVTTLGLTGCATIVIGEPEVQRDRPPGSDPGVVVGADGDEIDQLAGDALADLEDYWSQQLPEVFGTEFLPLQGGYFSVDPGAIDPAQYPQGVGCGSDPAEVENNAFYCQAQDAPNSDSITYDRAFLGELAGEFGRFIPALVMAHEFGHAVQARVGSPEASIAVETQADCLAGSWTRWVADGDAERSQLREPELDELLLGYFQLRDPVGTSSAAESAHGSYFDRASAFQEGFDDGPTACRDEFGPERVFTQGRFVSDEDFRQQGNAPYADLIGLVERALPAFWERVFTESLDERFDPPSIEAFDGTAPDCAPDDRDLVYCEEGNLVGYDEQDLTPEVYELGDYAVATGIAVPYALAARSQLGLDPADPDALRSAVCLAGWFSAAVTAGEVPGVVISPGDLDESVLFLLVYGVEEDVLGAADLSGFQLVDLFRAGFVQGGGACGL
ncbi:neutral zinc metallopeptidase [Blastococcus haudaquaticus]|uniref:Predicted metalloprotease n=1 Tax=Blastococcus haudaquaticus TaxID=1938745 RepID=A0A286GD71_9ACTN|nr:neutral zinc metallopeptidase [Blastococcus haudaquaticus]SOD93186.1 Predicted metalloprotease [Blastococcus haudaquaticus]